MKKFICAVLALSMLFLASCSNGIAKYGIYQLESDNFSNCRINYRSESSFAILYGAYSERGACVQENSKLTVDIDDSDCVYVFEVKNGDLIYDAKNSIPSEDFVSSGIIEDGSIFTLAHESKGK